MECKYCGNCLYFNPSKKKGGTCFMPKKGGYREYHQMACKWWEPLPKGNRGV